MDEDWRLHLVQSNRLCKDYQNLFTNTLKTLFTLPQIQLSRQKLLSMVKKDEFITWSDLCQPFNKTYHSPSKVTRSSKQQKLPSEHSESNNNLIETTSIDFWQKLNYSHVWLMKSTKLDMDIQSCGGRQCQKSRKLSNGATTKQNQFTSVRTFKRLSRR